MHTWGKRECREYLTKGMMELCLLKGQTMFYAGNHKCSMLVITSVLKHLWVIDHMFLTQTPKSAWKSQLVSCTSVNGKHTVSTGFKAWIVQSLDRAKPGSCKAWILQSLDRAKVGVQHGTWASLNRVRCRDHAISISTKMIDISPTMHHAEVGHHASHRASPALS